VAKEEGAGAPVWTDFRGRERQRPARARPRGGPSGGGAGWRVRRCGSAGGGRSPWPLTEWTLSRSTIVVVGLLILVAAVARSR